ncbi:MAG TPA: OmpA family protein [Flavobacteriales bacterium]|nr:OmpA family protein [Flavobacteriales bacterium]
MIRQLYTTGLLSLLALAGFSQEQTVSFNVFFNTDSYTVSDKEQSSVKRFLGKMDTVKITGITVTAFCDDRGNTGYNDTLSANRANAVKEFLSGLNYPATLFTKIAGRSELPIDEASKKGISQQRAQNRRAEITITYTPKASNGIDKILSGKFKVGDKITLSRLLFIGGRHQLLEESYATMDSLTEYLQKNTWFDFMILGHICCEPPGKDGEDFETGLFNLSEARAKAIYDYLIAKGIAASRMGHKGMKSDFKTGKEDKYDRRVEFEITRIRPQ